MRPSVCDLADLLLALLSQLLAEPMRPIQLLARYCVTHPLDEAAMSVLVEAAEKTGSGELVSQLKNPLSAYARLMLVQLQSVSGQLELMDEWVVGRIRDRDSAVHGLYVLAMAWDAKYTTVSRHDGDSGQ